MSRGRLLRPFGISAVEAPTAAQAADFDRFSLSEVGVPQAALMENAGRQAALLVQHLYPTGPVVALVGAGNNGGDALVCLRALASWGRDVSAVLVAGRPREDPLLHGWRLHCTPYGDGDGTERSSAEEMLRQAGVIVDGILGTGLQGAPRSSQAEVIDHVNTLRAPVVSLDAPSGVNGSTGVVAGSVVHADVTVAFGWPKLGTLLHPGRERVGRLVAVEIGFPPLADQEATQGWARVITPGFASRLLPSRPLVTHKNAVGALLLLAGSKMPGAAILAARAAFRAGVGLVRVGAGSEIRDGLLSACPEVMFVDAEDSDALTAALEESDALGVGPGLGTDDRALGRLEVVLAARGARSVVLDADALTLVAGLGRNLRPELSKGHVLVTPHPGEMARMTRQTVPDVQSDRPGVASRYAAETGCVALLKGTPSLVAGPEGTLWVDGLGSSDLAVAGMGDVLTGTAAGLLAQGLGAEHAACAALHLTGQGARQAALGPSLTPSDVVDQVASALLERGDGTTDLPFPFVTFDQDPPN